MADRSLRKDIEKIALEAGNIIKSASLEEIGTVSKEGHANFVTKYDRLVQEYLIDALKGLLPEASFVGEEEGQEAFREEYKKGYTFVIDPIDGTSNFMKGYRPSVTSIGLLLNGAPYLGVVYSPFTEELFSAEKGQGAACNGKTLLPCEDPLDRSLVLMGTAPYYETHVSKSAFLLGHYYLLNSIDIRRSGSAAYDLCQVATGRAGLFYEPRLCLWDYTAGAVILEEAGGVITDMLGKPLTYAGKSSILAATKGVAACDYLPPKNLLPKDI